MENWGTLIIVAIVIAVAVGGCVMVGLVVDETGIAELELAKAGARIAEAETAYVKAEAERTDAEATLADAQADIERAAGERRAMTIQASAEAKLYEAAAASVRKDSRLVAWDAVRNDVRIIIIVLALLPFEIGAGIAAGVVAE